jgi:hypothetical protein
MVLPFFLEIFIVHEAAETVEKLQIRYFFDFLSLVTS